MVTRPSCPLVLAMLISEMIVRNVPPTQSPAHWLETSDSVLATTLPSPAVSPLLHTRDFLSTATTARNVSYLMGQTTVVMIDWRGLTTHISAVLNISTSLRYPPPPPIPPRPPPPPLSSQLPRPGPGAWSSVLSNSVLGLSSSRTAASVWRRDSTSTSR